jgi:RimJ/RimL family protein N-acetyltransferase
VTDAPARVTSATIATPRLRLDPLRPEDAEELVGVLGDPALYVFTGGEPPTLDELRRRFEALAAGAPAGGDDAWRNWIVRLRDDGTAIGTVQATITRGGRQADLAWVLGTASQGSGFATEAANAMLHALLDEGVVVLTAHIREDHAASAGVARRLGLIPTGEFEDGEQVWRLDVGARDAAKRRRLIRLNVAVGVALIGFALFEVAMARTGRLPRSGDQLARDLLLAGAGVAMIGWAVLTWVRGRRSGSLRDDHSAAGEG